MTDLEKARHEGAVEMLEMVRASLRSYPYGGGDIEVMKEVERIANEAYRKGESNG